MNLFSGLIKILSKAREQHPFRLTAGVITLFILLTGGSFVAADFIGPDRTVVTSSTWTRAYCRLTFFVEMPYSKCADFGFACPSKGYIYGHLLVDYLPPDEPCPVYTDGDGFALWDARQDVPLPEECLTNTDPATQVVCYWDQVTRTDEDPEIKTCREGQISCTSTSTYTTYDPATVSGTVSCSAFGDNDWCVGSATLNLSSTEPLSGYSITKIESSLGDLCPSSGECVWDFPEGETSLNYWAVSSFGDTSTQESVTMKVDSVAPTANLSITGTLHNGWYNGNDSIIFTAVGADEASGIASTYVQVDSETPVASPLTFAGEGVYAVSSLVADNAGNLANSEPATIKIDRTAPSVYIMADITPSDLYYLGETTISALGSDALSGYDRTDYTLTDPDGVASSGTLPVTLSAEGTNEIALTSYDVAGNGTPNSLSYTLDLTPPIVSALTSGTSGSNGWFTTSVTLDVDASDTVSGVCSASVTVNGSPDWEIVPVTISDEGVNTFFARAYDCAGRDSVSDSVTVKIDTVNPAFAPTIQGIVGENGWYTGSVTVRAHASDSTSGVDSVSPSTEITFSTDGVHPAPSFTAVDNAGNTASTTLASEIKVDQTPPFVVIDDLPDAFFGSVTLTGSASDPTSGLNSLELSLNSGLSWTTLAVEPDGTWSQSGTTFVLMGDNPLAIVRAKDNAGNVATATIDPDALATPTFTATVPASSVPPQPTSTPAATATFTMPTWTPTAALTTLPSATATAQPTLTATIVPDSGIYGTLNASLGDANGMPSSPSENSPGDSSGDPGNAGDSSRSETIFFGLIPVTAEVKSAVEEAAPVAATTVAVTAAIGGAVALGSPAAAAFRPEWLTKAYSSLSVFFFALIPMLRREEKDGENDRDSKRE